MITTLEDDLNTPLAIGHLHELAHLAFTDVGNNQKHAANMLKACGQFLGLLTIPPKIWFQEGTDSEAIDQLVRLRFEAKQAKNFAEADRIRNELLSRGIALEDGPSGTIWRRS